MKTKTWDWDFYHYEELHQNYGFDCTKHNDMPRFITRAITNCRSICTDIRALAGDVVAAVKGDI